MPLADSCVVVGWRKDTPRWVGASGQHGTESGGLFLVALNLCAMRQCYLGEGDLVSTFPPNHTFTLVFFHPNSCCTCYSCVLLRCHCCCNHYRQHYALSFVITRIPLPLPLIVWKVIASGIAADNPGTEQSDMPPLSSTPSTGSGPVLGFSTSISQVRVG